MEKSTTAEAFQSMILFLETYYEQTQADDIGVLLGSLQLLEDSKSADSALWQDWLKSSESVIFSSIYHLE